MAHNLINVTPVRLVGVTNDMSGEIPLHSIPSCTTIKSIYLLNFAPDSEGKKKFHNWFSSINMLIGLIVKENKPGTTGKNKTNKRGKTQILFYV